MNDRSINLAMIVHKQNINDVYHSINLLEYVHIPARSHTNCNIYQKTMNGQGINIGGNKNYKQGWYKKNVKNVSNYNKTYYEKHKKEIMAKRYLNNK